MTEAGGSSVATVRLGSATARLGVWSRKFGAVLQAKPPRTAQGRLSAVLAASLMPALRLPAARLPSAPQHLASLFGARQRLVCLPTAALLP